MRVLVPVGDFPPGDLVGQRVKLDEAEVHHLLVRRATDQELVEILDGRGLRGSGRLIHSGKRWSVEISGARREDRPPELRLAVAAGDRERFSWLVEKAAELGVTTIVPLETTRTGGVASGLREAHIPRLRRHALEATKQCGVAWALQVEEPVPLPSFVERPAPGLRLVADRSGAAPPAELDADPVTVVIGPEGGLTEDELGSLRSAGYQAVALAKHTLRFETAALAVAAVASIARMRGTDG